MRSYTWGKPYLLKGAVALYRRERSTGGARSKVQWLVEADGRPVLQCSLMRVAVARFRELSQEAATI
jgi:hypothetical protein